MGVKMVRRRRDMSRAEPWKQRESILKPIEVMVTMTSQVTCSPVKALWARDMAKSSVEVGDGFDGSRGCVG